MKEQARIITTRQPSMASTLVAAVAASMGAAGLAFGNGGSQPRARRTHTPTMVISPAAEIAAWNAKVAARSDRLDRVALRRRDRIMDRTWADNGQHPQFPKARVHKQAKHPQRDKHGAYTCVGPVVHFEPGFDGVPVDDAGYRVMGGSSEGDWYGRRIWLAGISAQRGY